MHVNTPTKTYDTEAVRAAINFENYYRSELGDFRVYNNGQAKVLCCFHKEETASLSIDVNEGTFNCFGCGASGFVFEFFALKQGLDRDKDFQKILTYFGDRYGVVPRRITQKVITPPVTKGKIVSSDEIKKRVIKEDDLVFYYERFHFYKDGDPPYIKVIFKNKDTGKKTGRFYTLKDKAKRLYQEGRQSKPVLYNQEALEQRPNEFVTNPEGEKDNDSLTPLGYLSVTPGGANDFNPEKPEHIEMVKLLSGRDVYIFPDNDEAGRECVHKKARGLIGIAKSIRVVNIPNLSHKGDISDYIEAQKKDGKTPEEIKQAIDKLIEQAPEWTAPVITETVEAAHTGEPLDPLSFLKKGSELQLLDCKIEWIIDKLLPKQSITLLHGRGGIGKTWVCLILANATSKGVQFMGQETQSMPVVFIDFENSLPVLVDRIRKIGIEDVLFWHNSNEVLQPPKLDNPKWEQYKTLPPGSLLIFDTLRASQGQDENDSQKMAFVMARLKELRDAGFTILLLHHTPKGNDRTYKGSTAILDLADHVLSLHRVKKNNLEEETDDEGEECFYRLGTKDKTRYEPFHLFMGFDKEKGFKKALDPDTEDMEAIRDILSDRGQLNQTQLFDIAKTHLEIASKGKLTSLLHKGDGKYWKSTRERRAVYYEALSTVQLSTPYMPKAGQIGGTVQTNGTDTPSEEHKTLDNTVLSNCPGGSWTSRTDEVLDLTGAENVV